MADNSFNNTVESLFKGMDSFITTKTVVGDAIHIGDTIILPLVDVSFGVAAGAFSAEKKNNGAGGMGGKIQPSAVLVIQNGQTKLVNVKNQDGMTKILDMVPDHILFRLLHSYAQQVQIHQRVLSIHRISGDGCV